MNEIQTNVVKAVLKAQDMVTEQGTKIEEMDKEMRDFVLENIVNSEK